MNPRLIRRVFSYIKYQGSIMPFCHPEFEREVTKFENEIKRGVPQSGEQTNYFLYKWLTREGLIELLTRKFDPVAYREGYRKAHSKGTGRGRKRQNIHPDEEKVTLLYFLAKELDDKHFPHLTQKEIVALYNSGGLQALEDKALDKDKFKRSFYATWKVHISMNPVFILEAPEAFFDNQQNWEAPLHQIGVARKSENVLFLWEALSPIGKATLRLLYEAMLLEQEIEST